MSNEISAADSRILSFIMKPGDYPDFIPVTAVQVNNPSSPNKRISDTSSFPSEVVDVYAVLDVEDTNGAKGKPYSPPSIIKLANLTNKGINFVSGNQSTICAISSSNKILISSTNVEDNRSAHVNFHKEPSLKDYVYYTACGMNHTITLAVRHDTASPVVYATGSNSEGQLGFKGEDLVTYQKEVSFPCPTPCFIQAACGNNFTLLLTDTCDVWAFGHNHHGQLRLRTQQQKIFYPQLVSCLQGLPITSIAAGLGHSLALTSTGLVYAAGRNDKGQLGSPSASIDTFIPVESLSGVFIVHIAACQNTSAAIDEFGTVYLWGDQWGSTPTAVTLDAPDQFVDIAVGNDGRFAALSSENALYVYGYYNGNGQQMNKVIKILYPQQPYFRVFSCGNYFAVLAGPNKPLLKDTNAKCLSLLPPNRPIIKDRLRAPPKVLLLNGAHFPSFVTFKNAKQIVNTVFSNLSTINGSFILDRFSESQTTCGVDVELVNSVYDQFSTAVSRPLMDELDRCFIRTLKNVQEKPPAIIRPTTMRFFITALLHPSLTTLRGSTAYDFWDTLVMTILKSPQAKEILIQWISLLQEKTIKQILKSLNDYLNETTSHTGLYGQAGRGAVDALRIIWNANNRSQKLPFEAFYNFTLCDKLDPKQEMYGIRKDQQMEWCYCLNAPWLVTPALKISLVRTMAESIMNNFYIQACRNATQFENGRPKIVAEDVWLILKVNREKILTTTIDELNKIKNITLQAQKRLKVQFEGEPGVDEGGVQREFFDMIVKKLTSPDLSLFVQMRDCFWFNKDLDPFLFPNIKLAGQIVGLAIYNGNFINIRFPLALYKKLKGVSVGINDLEEIDPQLVSTLMNILSYEGDVENDMCLDFTYENVELVPKGSQIPVTNANRQSYVDLIVDYVLNKSIDEQFRKFKEGFFTIPTNLDMPLFRPEELSLMVAGEDELDFTALEKNTTYENYTTDSPAVKLFWKIVRDKLNIDEKKKLLYFVTSSPRAPIGGLGKVPFKIMRDGDPNHIPTSHTCFYILVLPDITDEATMLKRIRIAIENSQGFQFK